MKEGIEKIFHMYKYEIILSWSNGIRSLLPKCQSCPAAWRMVIRRNQHW